MLNKIIKATTPDMILLQGGEPKTIGGIYANMDLEFEDGILIKSDCVFFNLDSLIESTDFFLFNAENHKLVNYSIGLKTDPFFKKMYLKVLTKPSNYYMKPFINEFVSEYVSEGLVGNFPSIKASK